MKILIATDGSEFSREAIREACRMLANNESHSIKVIAVYEEVSYTGTEPFAVSTQYIREMEAVGREQAVGFASDAEEVIRGRFADSNFEVTTKVAKGAPGRAIVEEAQDWGADLIVVGSHGYGFWGRAFLGSTSDKVIHHAPCSVLVVRKKADAGAADGSDKDESYGVERQKAD